jgi:hypothetical protein
LLRSKNIFFLDKEIRELVEGILDLLTNVTGKLHIIMSQKFGSTFLLFTLGHKKNQRGGFFFCLGFLFI